MLIDGSVFYVRRNLYCALRELRPAYGLRTLWIDAICINQNPSAVSGCADGRRLLPRRARRRLAWRGRASTTATWASRRHVEYFLPFKCGAYETPPKPTLQTPLRRGLRSFWLSQMWTIASSASSRPISGRGGGGLWTAQEIAQEIALAREIECNMEPEHCLRSSFLLVLERDEDGAGA